MPLARGMKGWWRGAVVDGSGWTVWLGVFVWALGLRLTFALLSAGTFDPDEFVVLTLSRAVAHGATLYRDVTYFHPPGMLVLFRWLQPLVTRWWPIGRLLTLLVDSLTAVIVWRIGTDLFGRSEGVVAGLIYGASPVALVSAVRIGPDPIITALGCIGLVLLLTSRQPRGSIAAGLCLALAVWTKYTAILYLPLYLLAAPRQARSLLLSWGAATLCLFAPVLGQVGALIDQTVIWQLGRRGHADLYHRLSSVIAYWLLLNPLGLVALRRRRRPLWLPVGFCLGATFLLTAQAYYHYFALVVPFAALLAAPVVTSLARRRPRLLVACLLCLACLWGLDVGYGPPVLRLHVTASRLTPVRQTAAILDRATRPNETILTDEFEYALMAHRPLAANYFWDMEGMVQARSLEEQLAHLAAVVTTKGSEGYPRGFVDYLEDMHYPSVQTPRTIVWLIRSTS